LRCWIASGLVAQELNLADVLENTAYDEITAMIENWTALQAEQQAVLRNANHSLHHPLGITGRLAV